MIDFIFPTNFTAEQQVMLKDVMLQNQTLYVILETDGVAVNDPQPARGGDNEMP